MQLAPALFPHLQPWLVLLIATLTGVLGAVLAVFAERVAFGVDGFFIGALLSLHAAQAFRIPDLNLLLVFGGGVIAAMVTVLLTDWAIIVLASFTGASVVVTAIGLSGALALGVLAVLFIVGAAVQRSFMGRLKRS